MIQRFKAVKITTILRNQKQLVMVKTEESNNRNQLMENS